MSSVLVYDPESLRDLVEVQGLRHYEVAARLGCSRGHVSELCRRHGVKAQRRGPRGGEGHPNWNGGSFVDGDGYVSVWMPDHPSARKSGRVLEHRLVMEAHIGRHLHPDEVVHHRNGDRSDNRVENLEVFASNAEHLRHELTGRVPRWTEDGLARIRAGVRRRGTIRAQSVHDEMAYTGTNCHPKG